MDTHLTSTLQVVGNGLHPARRTVDCGKRYNLMSTVLVWKEYTLTDCENKCTLKSTPYYGVGGRRYTLTSTLLTSGNK
jgi:hypothetical protein